MEVAATDGSCGAAAEFGQQAAMQLTPSNHIAQSQDGARGTRPWCLMGRSSSSSGGGRCPRCWSWWIGERRRRLMSVVHSLLARIHTYSPTHPPTNQHMHTQVLHRPARSAGASGPPATGPGESAAGAWAAAADARRVRPAAGGGGGGVAGGVAGGVCVLFVGGGVGWWEGGTMDIILA